MTSQGGAIRTFAGPILENVTNLGQPPPSLASQNNIAQTTEESPRSANPLYSFGSPNPTLAPVLTADGTISFMAGATVQSPLGQLQQSPLQTNLVKHSIPTNQVAPLNFSSLSSRPFVMPSPLLPTNDVFSGSLARTARETSLNQPHANISTSNPLTPFHPSSNVSEPRLLPSVNSIPQPSVALSSQPMDTTSGLSTITSGSRFGETKQAPQIGSSQLASPQPESPQSVSSSNTSPSDNKLWVTQTAATEIRDFACMVNGTLASPNNQTSPVFTYSRVPLEHVSLHSDPPVASAMLQLNGLISSYNYQFALLFGLTGQMQDVLKGCSFLSACDPKYVEVVKDRLRHVATKGLQSWTDDIPVLTQPASTSQQLRRMLFTLVSRGDQPELILCLGTFAAKSAFTPVMQAFPQPRPSTESLSLNCFTLPQPVNMQAVLMNHYLTQQNQMQQTQAAINHLQQQQQQQFVAYPSPSLQMPSVWPPMMATVITPYQQLLVPQPPMSLAAAVFPTTPTTATTAMLIDTSSASAPTQPQSTLSLSLTHNSRQRQRSGDSSSSRSQGSATASSPANRQLSLKRPARQTSRNGNAPSNNQGSSNNSSSSSSSSSSSMPMSMDTQASMTVYQMPAFISSADAMMMSEQPEEKISALSFVVLPKSPSELSVPKRKRGRPKGTGKKQIAAAVAPTEGDAQSSNLTVLSSVASAQVLGAPTSSNGSSNVSSNNSSTHEHRQRSRSRSPRKQRSSSNSSADSTSDAKSSQKQRRRASRSRSRSRDDQQSRKRSRSRSRSKSSSARSAGILSDNDNRDATKRQQPPVLQQQQTTLATLASAAATTVPSQSQQQQPQPSQQPRLNCPFAEFAVATREMQQNASRLAKKKRSSSSRSPSSAAQRKPKQSQPPPK